MARCVKCAYTGEVDEVIDHFNKNHADKKIKKF